FTQTRALSCSPDGKLYVAGHNSEDAFDQLLILDPEAGYKLLSRSRTEVSILSIAAGPDRLFVAGFREGSPFPLHLLTPQGGLIRSFGESGGKQVNPVLTRGFLLWNRQNARLLFLPQRLAEIQVYDSAGNPVRVKGLGPNQPL